MAKIRDENVLMERVVKMLPKGIPAEAIDAVECDPWDCDEPTGSYWVYLSTGWKCDLMECHTIHEATLKDLKVMIDSIVPWPDDPDYEIIRKNA